MKRKVGPKKWTWLSLGVVLVAGTMVLPQLVMSSENKIEKDVGSVKINPIVTVEKKGPPIGYPYISYGEIRWDEGDISEGLVLDSYFEQGIDIYQFGPLTWNAFLGAVVIQSSENDEYWNNKIGPRIGTQLKMPFEPWQDAMGTAALGIRAQYNIYSSDEKDDNDLQWAPFFNWWMGGNWRSIDKAIDNPGSIPIGYPYSFRGELSYATGDIEEGVIFDMNVQQGIDWIRFGRWTLNTFLGAQYTQSTEDEDTWNNKFRPYVGVRLKDPFSLSDGGWGFWGFGVRAEYNVYTSDLDREDDYRTIFFLQWEFGGNW